MEKYPFSCEKAEFVLDSFAKTTGLSCRLIDEEGNTVKHIQDKYNVYENLKLNDDQLKESYLYGANQALVYGGSYIFFGPFGFVHFTTPIISSDKIVGAFVVGPILMTQRDQFLFDLILSKSEYNESNKNEIVRLLDTIPVISTGRVKAYSDLLLCSVHYAASEGYDRFERDQKQMEQRSEIVTYMSYLKTMGGETLEGSAYPVEKEKELMNLISIGDKEGSNRVLNEIMAHIYIGYGMDFKLLKSRVLELVVLLSRAAIEGGAVAEDIFGLNYSYLNEINDYDTVDQLTSWLAKITNKFSASVFRFGQAKHKDSIYKAMAYIKRSYMEKITLEEVAQHVYFSAAYFSKIFKDETGITFNKYLNKVRIAASKQLLKEKDISLADIAEAVGFHDQSHFSKMFKSATQLSPKKFRESLKQ